MGMGQSDMEMLDTCRMGCSGTSTWASSPSSMVREHELGAHAVTAGFYRGGRGSLEVKPRSRRSEGILHGAAAAAALVLERP